MAVTAEIDWKRPTPEVVMSFEEFNDILRDRVVTVEFVNMFSDALLIRAEGVDKKGRELWKIRLNKNNTFEEQAEDLIHEVAHIHFESPYKGVIEQIGLEEDPYEDFIIKEGERFFNNHRDLVIRICGTLFNDYLLESNTLL